MNKIQYYQKLFSLLPSFGNKISKQGSMQRSSSTIFLKKYTGSYEKAANLTGAATE